MNGIELTAKELLFAAARLGAETFYGIPDPFFGMDDSDVAQALLELPLALEEKGYADLSFDDAFELSAQAAELVSVCALCDGYITARLPSPAGETQAHVFYLRTGNAVHLHPTGERIVLRPVDTEKIAEWIWTQLCWPEQEATAFEEPVFLPLSVLEQVNKQTKGDLEGAAALLEQAGGSGRIAGILADGLQGKAGYCAVCATDLRARDSVQIVCIGTTRGSARIAPVYDGVEERWEISPIRSGELREKLEQLCSATASKGGAWGDELL